jgi:hypothetical protein
MTKLTAKEKKRRAAKRFKIREQKFTRKQWAEKYEPELRESIAMVQYLLSARAARAWRENAPPHMQKVKPLIDKIYRSMKVRP